MTTAAPSSPAAVKASIWHNFQLARRLEGTSDQPDALGVWGITSKRALFGWGWLPATVFPADLRSGDPVPPAPGDATAQAAVHRTAAYRRVWTAAECAELTGGGSMVSAGLTITTNWLDYGGGIIAPTTHPTIGAHAVTVVGADAGRRTLRLFNAKWAPAWGDGGYGVMSFDYFDQHLVEAYTSAQHLVELPRGNRQVLLSPLITRDSSHEVLVFRRPDGDTERCAWAMLTHTAAVTEVDDLYVRPEYRRHGLGQWLWQQLIDLSRLQGRSLRLWVPFADCDPEHLELLRHFFGKRGYALHPSSRPSAGCEVRPGPMPAVVPAVVIPERPALDRTSAVEAAIKLGMAVGPNGPPGWRELNTERAALIRKRRQVGLDPAEQARFDRLQALAHRIVDANLPPPLSDAERAYLTARDPLRQTL